MTPKRNVILNVDDNEAKRYTITRVLQRAGFEVLEGRNGTEALSKAKEQPDLIILDVKLPDYDGFEVCRRLKSDTVTSSIPIVHLSASFVDTLDKVRGLDYGADGYLTYPVEPTELVATVRSLLRISEAETLARQTADEWYVTFNAISEGICLLDQQGNIRRCNEGFAKLVDSTTDAIAGQSFDALLRANLGLSAESPLWYAELIGGRSTIEFDGEHRSFRVSVDPVSSTSGAVYVVSDITDRRKMEEQLATAYEKERRIAESLQRSLLITVPENTFPGVAIASFYEPAWEEASIGGDFYDTFLLSDDHLALVVGDASGKGLAAATRTAEVKFALRAFLHEHGDPSVALVHLNNFICELSSYASDDTNNIVALSLAIIDTRTGICNFASAGAERAIIVRSDGTQETVPAHGLPLGAFASVDFDVESVQINQGDLIFLITDGLTEARHEGDLLGSDGLEALINAQDTDASLREIGMGVVNGARDYAGGNFQDDACVLLIRRIDPALTSS